LFNTRIRWAIRDQAIVQHLHTRNDPGVIARVLAVDRTELVDQLDLPLPFGRITRQTPVDEVIETRERAQPVLAP
jgi:hypothetical protein